MVRLVVVGVLAVLAAGAVWLAVAIAAPWSALAAVLVAITAIGVWDLLQRKHSVLRNYPVLGHLRFLLEALRSELQQYFVERNFDGRPFDRDIRSIVYERAKATEAEEPFGTEEDVYANGYESFVDSMASKPRPEQPPFGSLSANAILALNKGAALGGFAHDTGEGGLSEYHLRHGGDIVWEIGTGYFGCRTEDGGFDGQEFAGKAAHDAVKCVSLKLSQGAKPGIGGVLPGGKVNAEIAEVRGVPESRAVISPPYQRVFAMPRELIRFVTRMRELAGGKPTGFKLCLGARSQFLAVCKAARRPHRHAADRRADHRSGKVATGADMVKRMTQGADYTNAARGGDKSLRVQRFQRATVSSAVQIMASIGVRHPDDLRPHMLRLRDGAGRLGGRRPRPVRRPGFSRGGSAEPAAGAAQGVGLPSPYGKVLPCHGSHACSAWPPRGTGRRSWCARSC